MIEILAGARADGPGRARRVAFLWLAAHIPLTFLAFPHPMPFAGGRVLDLGWLVSWAVPASLILGLRALSVRRAAGLGFATTVLAHGFVLHFIYVVTVRYGHAPAAIGLLAPFLLALYPGALGAVFGAVWAWLSRRQAAGPFAAALLWTSLDYLRSMALTGWPWATLGYAQHLNPGLLGLAQWTGVYGLSFAVALLGAALAVGGLALSQGRRVPTSCWVALGVVLLMQAVGYSIRIVPGENDAMGLEPLRLAAIQGNIDQGVKWEPGRVEQTLRSYEDLSRRAADAGAQVIVWPETAVPGALELEHDVQARLTALARETGAVLIVGSVGVTADPGTGRIASFFDSAFVVTEAGVVDRYDKTHLVPFGEYVPLRRLLGRFLSSVAGGMARDDVTPGGAPRALSIDVAPERRSGAPVKVGIPICYELLFPDLVRRFVKDGGGVLLAITNDAWYGRTGAPYQFLAITALRSAETGVYIVRAANTGVSAIIDSGGWVREQTPIFERTLLVADVPLRRSDASGTFYVRHGDVFAQACCAALLLLLLLARFAGSRPR